MTGICRDCSKMFDGTEEDTNGPNVQCADCYKKTHPRKEVSDETGNMGEADS